MGAASKKILAHQLLIDAKEGCPFTDEQVVILLNNAIRHYQPPKMIHTENGLSFKRKRFSQYLKKQKIKQSLRDQQIIKFPNQAHERLNRSLKDLFRKRIQRELNLKKIPIGFGKLSELGDNQKHNIFN